jgi:hypothetical protein
MRKLFQDDASPIQMLNTVMVLKLLFQKNEIILTKNIETG